jgi:hypothetical protein
MTKARDLANGGFGLVLVKPSSVVNGTDNGKGTVTFSAQTSVSLNGVFNSTYDNYRIVFFPTAGSGALTMRLRASGSDNSSSVYIYRGATAGDSTLVRYAGSAQTNWNFDNGINASHATTIELFQPNISKSTLFTMMGTNLGSASSGSYISIVGGHYANSIFDGFTLFASGDMTGSVSVYGYNK